MHQVLNFYKNKGKTKFNFKELAAVMKNLENQQFNYDSFKTAYDSDPRLQRIVANFDQNTVELNTGPDNTLDDQKPRSPNNVEKMAKRAVDL